MHICVTGPKTCPPEIGGIEVFGYEVGRTLAGRGMRISIVCSAVGHPPGTTRLDGIDIVRIRGIPQRHLLKLSMMPGIRSAVRRLRPDIVHANDATSGYAVASMKDRPKLVVTVHGLGFSKADWAPPFRQGIEYFQTRAVERADVVVATDRRTAQEFEELRSDIRVIAPGVDVKTFSKNRYQRPAELTQDRFNILYVGRLTKVKGFDLAVRGVDAVAPIIRDRISLTVIGSGPLAESASGTKADIRLLGELPHAKLPAYFSNADLVIQPSRSEGVPITILEAMASNTPVAATMVGGVGTCFDERHLVPITEITPTGVATAIEYAVSNADDITKRSDNAFRKVRDEFSWESVADKYQEIFRTL